MNIENRIKNLEEKVTPKEKVRIRVWTPGVTEKPEDWGDCDYQITVYVNEEELYD